MKSSQERAAEIDNRKKARERTERLWVRTGRQEFEVFEVPTDALVLNVDNRRFRVRRLWAEEQLGRPLDPEAIQEDGRTIESLLLDDSLRLNDEATTIVGTPSGDTTALMRDLLARGQDAPLWIRSDGTVRNGNRRLATMQRLARDQGDAAFHWVEAIILDEQEIDEPTLLEMEQREQVTSNYKVKYDDIDYLLALKEAAELRDIVFDDPRSIDEIAGQLQTTFEKSKSEMTRDLFAIRYMDLFLEVDETPGRYQRLSRNLERFRATGQQMARALEDYPDEAADLLQVCYAAIRAGEDHFGIRKIGRLFREDRERFHRLASEITEAEEDWTPEPAEVSSSPAELDPSIGDEDEQPPGPQETNYPEEEVETAIAVAVDGFVTSREPKVLRDLRLASNKLDAVDGHLQEAVASGGSEADQIRRQLAEVVSFADRHRALLAEDA